LRERIALAAEGTRDSRAGHTPGTQSARQDEGGAIGHQRFAPLERKREVPSTSFVSSVRARQAGHGLSFEINPALPKDMKDLLTTAKEMAASVRETVSTALYR
jgi:stringent starvation protein B